MLKSLLVYGVLGVLLIPAKGDNITVCIDNNNDLRVECQLKPESTKPHNYQFSWSSGNKAVVISTNVSGSSPDNEFKGKITVTQRKAYGYQMTLPNFTEKLTGNSTFFCKLSEKTARIVVEKDKLPKCSAASVFLRSPTSWIICLLLSFYQTQS